MYWVFFLNQNIKIENEDLFRPHRYSGVLPVLMFCTGGILAYQPVIITWSKCHDNMPPLLITGEVKLPKMSAIDMR